ncbi:MAG: IclR family transcriptional regulator [Actinobacteria bacterium]|nr:IclR family transcriptional regulator [Actinomycetota bacterium]
MTADSPSDRGRPVAAVQRAIAVLETLAAADTDVGTNEIARRTGINASSVSRLLATLGRAELVAQDADTGRYRLGLRMLRFGTAVLSRLDLRDVARPHLQALSSATGETATLSMAGGGGEALTVDFVQSPSSVQSVARVGRPSVAHATAVGKVMLACTDQQVAAPLERYTDATIVDPAQLRAEVERTRAREWGEAVGEREVDLHAVAVPVHAADGALLAILGVQGPAGRLTASARRDAVAHLTDAARQIEATFAGGSVPA